MKYGSEHANYGNTYYKGNIGKTYNNTYYGINGKAEKCKPYKILIHYDSNMKIKHISTVFCDGHINEVHEPQTIPKPTEKYIKSWHSETVKYYRGGKLVMIDVTFNKYLKDDVIIKKEMRP